MKIIEALKKIKHLDRKIKKAMDRIAKWSSFIAEFDTTTDPAQQLTEPTYTAENIRTMQQQITDWLAEKMQLRHCLHVTNVQTTFTWKGKEMSIDHGLLLKETVLPKTLEMFRSQRRAEKGGLGGYGSRDMSGPGYRCVMQFDPRERDLAIDDMENQIAPSKMSGAGIR